MKKYAHLWIESKKVPRSAMGENENFSDFFKSFLNEENHHIFTPEQLKYKNSLIWMKNVRMCELSQKGSKVRDGRKLQFFLFFEKFSKMKKIIIVSLQDN